MEVPAAAPSATEVQPTAAKSFSLEEAIDRAERVHPELASARARVEAAGGRIVQAGLYPNPRAVARIESAPFEGSTLGQAEYVGGVSVPVYVPGRFSKGRRVEELDRGRLEQEYEAKRLEVVARVRGSFATGMYSEQVIRVQEEALLMTEKGVAIVNALLEGGDAVPEDVARAEMEHVQARVELDRARSLHDLALADLSTAMGDPGTRIESLQGALDAALEIPTLESLSRRLPDHPLLRSAEAAVDTQRARVDFAEIHRVPDVNLDLFYRRLQHSEQDSFDAGVSVALPIFDRNQGRIQEARAEVEAVQADARTVRNDLTLRLRELHSQFTRALSAAKVLRDEVLPRAETVLKASEARYSNGDIRLTDVLLVRRSRTTVQLAYLQSLRDVMDAWAKLSPFMAQSRT